MERTFAPFPSVCSDSFTQTMAETAGAYSPKRKKNFLLNILSSGIPMLENAIPSGV
jgi:hypothetical protein